MSNLLKNSVFFHACRKHTVLCHEKLTDLPGQPHDPATFGPAARDTLALHPSIGPCRVCHTTHSAQGPHLWAWAPATAAGRITDLCGACHGDKLGVLDSVHDPETAEWAQKPGFVPKGSCIDCHLVHDPNEEGGIWAFVRDEADTSQSCETCHRAGGPAQAMKAAHLNARYSIRGTGFQPVKTRPGWPCHIQSPESSKVVAPDGRILCTTCHDIHQKEQRAKLLVASVPDLCGTCHEDKLGIPGSVHDPGTAEWARELGFVSKGSCIDCHPIHDPPGEGGIWATIGGEGVLRKESIGQEQDCESCHRAGAPGPVMDTPHMGKTLGAELQNLPATMQVSPEKQILCTTCHDIHQKDQSPKLLASARQDSGICLVCHRQAGGLVGTLHDLRTSAPDARNMRGETAVESGPCGSCHLVHRNRSLVARRSSLDELRSANPERRDGPAANDGCTSCHRENQCASARVPEYADHPDVALVNRTRPGEPGYMPTFDGRGEPSRTGAISCLTCHEPHAAPSAAGARQGPSTHGRMFLRPGADRAICVDCHGTEALWRFLYYHRERRNPRAERNPNPPAPRK